MPNEPKLHHFLAESYLRRFADERGDLWVLDRKQGIVRRQSPEVTAEEREGEKYVVRQAHKAVGYHLNS